MAKIIHLTNTFIPEDSRILKAIDTGREQGHKVIGLGLFLPEKQHELDQDTLQDVQSFKLRSLNLTKAPWLFAKLCLVIEMMFMFAFSGIRHRPDIIHCHDAPALFAAVIIKIFTSAKLVYDAHELSSQRNGLSKAAQKLIFLAEKLVWPMIDALIIVSPSIQRWYTEHHKPKLNMVVLNAPYKLPAASQKSYNHHFGKDYFRDHYNIAKNNKVFIYLGFLCDGRGLEIMIDAFSRPDIRSDLVIIGYGPLEAKLRDLAKNAPSIHFHDAVKHQDVISLARAADFGICMIEPISLSDEYCLPNKLFEYAFSDLPVIASNLPDIAQLVSHYGLGICVDTNADSLHELLLSIQQGSIKIAEKRGNIDEFSYQEQSKKIIKIYDELLA